jgi:hypothetical protein
VPIAELLDVEGFRSALLDGKPVIITDKPTCTVTLHRSPASCPSVAERYFVQKVVENKRATGAYFRVDDHSADDPDVTRSHRLCPVHEAIQRLADGRGRRRRRATRRHLEVQRCEEVRPAIDAL